MHSSSEYRGGTIWFVSRATDTLSSLGTLTDTVDDCVFAIGISFGDVVSFADSPFKRDAVIPYKIAHADDISGLILAWVFALVRNKPFDPQEHCQLYHLHLDNYGLTALEDGG